MRFTTRLEIYGAMGSGKTHLANQLRKAGLTLKELARPEFSDLEVYTTATDPYIVMRHLAALGRASAREDSTVTVNLAGVHIGHDAARNIMAPPVLSEAEAAEMKKQIETKLDELDALIIRFRGGEPAGSAVIFWGDGGRDTWFRGCPACAAIQLEDLAAHLRATPADGQPAPKPVCH